MRHFRLSRDSVYVVAGLLGIAHETLGSGPERPYLLFVFTAMLGLPFVQALDRKRRDDS